MDRDSTFDDVLYQMKIIGVLALVMSAAAVGGVVGLVWALS